MVLWAGLLRGSANERPEVGPENASGKGEITVIVVSRLLVIVIAVKTIYSTELYPLIEGRSVILTGHILYVW